MTLMVMRRAILRGVGGGLILAATLGLGGCGKKKEATAASETPAAPAASAVSDLPSLGAAPVWKLNRIDGTELTSADLKGKVVVLDFWATWCPPCREEIPGYIKMQQAHEAAGLVIVGISLDQKGPPVVRAFAEEYGINYPLVMGDEKIVQAFGGIEAIPTTFLIDRDGQVRHRKVGMMGAADYEALIASLL